MSITEGGLLVPQGAHEEAVRDALKRHDPDLRLIPVESNYFGKIIYKVGLWRGSERPIEFIFTWADEQGNPYPLSMSIVDAIQRLDRNTRSNGGKDSDARNAELLDSRRRAADDEFDELEREFVKRIDGKFSSPLPRSQNLRRARDKARSSAKFSDEVKP